jgi:hypothetical protein
MENLGHKDTFFTLNTVLNCRYDFFSYFFLVENKKTTRVYNGLEVWLLEKVPNQPKSDNKIAIGHAGRRIKVIITEKTVNMFGNQENTRLSYASIEKNINYGKIPYLLLRLHKKLSKHGIVIVGKIGSKIIDGGPGLDKHGFFEPMVLVIETSSCRKFRKVKDGLALRYILIQNGGLESETFITKLARYFYRKIIDTPRKLLWSN